MSSTKRFPSSRTLKSVLVLSTLISAVGGQEPASQLQSHQANRLAGETSPYLLQHAHNPVHWYPWGEEALSRAKNENKPIFLSIGYSSCHWCHVMERESFEDEEIAAFLNENFVCIKVDREERPDIDSIYMMAVQIIARRGGWPLSVFLTPDTKPFFGGTYFPARDGDRPGTVGFQTVLKRVLDTWRHKRTDIDKSADQIADILRKTLQGEEKPQPVDLDRELMDRAVSEFGTEFDAEWGGFGYSADNPNIPKFPQGASLLFLSKMAKEKNPQATRFLVTTLDHIAAGGIRDHIGGGFHRYSVDRYWHIPHFEKMLYDNGQLATAYSDAFEVTGNEAYADVLREMLVFLGREMTAEGGAFYSALDADSDGEEGKFYRWDRAEWLEGLDTDEASLFEAVYTGKQPNFEGKYYVPMRQSDGSQLTTTTGLKREAIHERLRGIRAKLVESRNRRVRPMTDTKILTSWNGLMIRGLADAGRVLQEDAFLEAAGRAADFLLENVRTENGRLHRTYSQGEARLNGYLDDYAFLANGLLALHRATGEDKWLTAARQFVDKQNELFWDEDQGGYFFTSIDHEQLILRGKLFFDAAVPSGNAVAAENLIYLAKATGNEAYRTQAVATIQAAASELRHSPASVPRTCFAVSLWLDNE